MAFLCVTAQRLTAMDLCSTTLAQKTAATCVHLCRSVEQNETQLAKQKFGKTIEKLKKRFKFHSTLVLKHCTAIEFKNCDFVKSFCEDCKQSLQFCCRWGENFFAFEVLVLL